VVDKSVYFGAFVLTSPQSIHKIIHGRFFAIRTGGCSGAQGQRLFPDRVPEIRSDLDRTRHVTGIRTGAGDVSNHADGSGTSVEKLASIFNFVHFQDDIITVNFKHLEYNTVLSLEARPLPCLDGTLSCRWVDKDMVNDLTSFVLEELLVNDGLRLLSVKPAIKQISKEGISFYLPENAREISSRTIRRHLSSGIQAEIMRNGTLFRGVLSNFNSITLCVKLLPAAPQTFHWIDKRESVYLILKKDAEVLYSGECGIIRQSLDHKSGSGIVVFKPLKSQLSRFKSEVARSQRCQLVPAPLIYFKHPFSGKTVSLECDDLSESGLSVQEYYDNSVLLPGLNIQELFLEIAPNFTIKCKGQVVYSQAFGVDDTRSTVKCGIAFLDMALQDQTTLSALVQRADNKKGAQVCNKVNLDSLWKFFFEAGFLYQVKYANMHSQKDEFKALYKKLYIDNPDLARHFILQDRGEILAHISMIHAYEKTWLIHHHAARRTKDRKAGLTVLHQVSQYVGNFHTYHATAMQYIIAYYRPDNRFPERVFGGFYKHINNPDCCWVWPFIFFHLGDTGMSAEVGFNLLDRGGVEIAAASPSDIMEFHRYFTSKYNGLILEAVDLDSNSIDSVELTKKYEAAGLSRERRVYTVKKGGALQAIVAIIATGGLNLSNLTNCMKVFVIEPKLDIKVLFASLLSLAGLYSSAEMPVLLFASDHASRKNIPFEKIYHLWVLNLPPAADQFVQYLNSLTDKFARRTDRI